MTIQFPCMHLYYIMYDRVKRLHGGRRIVEYTDPNLTYASLMTLAYLRQSPVTRHTPITLETAYTRLTLALTGFRVAGVGHAAESVAAA